MATATKTTVEVDSHDLQRLYSLAKERLHDMERGGRGQSMAEDWYAVERVRLALVPLLPQSVDAQEN